MIRNLLLLAGVALAVPAFAQNARVDKSLQKAGHADVRSILMKDKAGVKAQINDGSVSDAARAKAPSATVQWKRPAGQFWGVGYGAESNTMGYYFTPLVVRPWVDYTFENISGANGTPSWVVTNWGGQGYVETESNEKDVTTSWIQFEQCSVPVLSYPNLLPYAQQYYGQNLTEYQGKVLGTIPVCANYDIQSIMGETMPVSSHYWGMFTREPVQKSGFGYYTGADVYEMQDEEEGMWFGTNNSGINAMATRFEKPEQPYLLNGVYFYYQFFTDINRDLPLKAYVFKTVDDAKLVQINDSVSKEKLEVGDLIATAESIIPKAVFDERENFQNAAKFEFFETNPVTGAKTAVSLEIEDDITIIVTGFNADPGDGGILTTFLSTDTFDEGYGNLAFLGSLEETEDGGIVMDMSALRNFFRDDIHNTTLGVLADVTYPWLVPYFNEPEKVHLPNDGMTTQESQGLQYELPVNSTSSIEDIEVTFNGEESCDWLNIIDAFDLMDNYENGEEYWTGICDIIFEADPNPDDVSRSCEVKLSIPGASYSITFLQGTNNTAVEIVGAEGNAEYFDLQGRRVANPEKGLYIKKSGNTTTKVIL